ncbi:MAG: CopD family protein [Nitrospirota bacterium]
MKKLHFAVLACLILLFSFPSPSPATPEFAQKTGLQCTDCHIDPGGGKQLTERGKQFLEEMKAKGSYRPLSTTQRVVRLFVGYFHMMAAIIWFGAILYIHILLKPAYASRGLPKGELRLGWISMIIVLVTGVLLTIARMPSWESFYTTRFGILLSIKIALFLLMLASVLIVTIYIRPRLKQQRDIVTIKESGNYALDELSRFDGKEGRPAYIAYKGVIYDVSQSKLWKNGAHMVKHVAGQDLTEVLKTAPHGEDKVLAMKVIGKLLSAAEKPSLPPHVRLFYFFAYMNLTLTFIIVFIIALWRWW